VLANSTWFSATAVLPGLQREWGLTAAGAAWLVVAVQAGFITGSIAAALLNLPDQIQPRRVIAGSAIAAATANALSRQPTEGVKCRASSYARTRSTRVLRMLDEIGKRYDTVQLAREDRRCLEPPLDPRQLRLNAGLTGSAPRPQPSPAQEADWRFHVQRPPSLAWTGHRARRALRCRRER
jgi:hypothetical protein